MFRRSVVAWIVNLCPLLRRSQARTSVLQRGISPQRSRRTQRTAGALGKGDNHGFLSYRAHKSLSLRPLRPLR